MPTVEVLFPSGALLVSDIIDGQYVKKQYFGYSKRDAISNFKEEHAHAYRKR